MLIAASAITDGDKVQPPKGVAIFGRNLNKALVDKIVETTKTNVTLLLPAQIQADSFLNDVLENLLKDESGHYSTTPTKEALLGYTIIKDVFGKPIGMFRMVTPRSIYLTGEKAISYYLISFVVLGVVRSEERR